MTERMRNYLSPVVTAVWSSKYRANELKKKRIIWTAEFGSKKQIRRLVGGHRVALKGDKN